MRTIQRERQTEIFANERVFAFCISANVSGGGEFRVFATNPEGIPDSIDGFPVKITTGPPVTALAPVRMGTSTSNRAAIAAGTLGTTVRPRSQPQRFGYLTNNHVAAADMGRCPNGIATDQNVKTEVAPGTFDSSDCGTPVNIGTLQPGFPIIMLDPNASNEVDAAFVESSPALVSSVNACGICPTTGGPTPILMPADALKKPARKCGRDELARPCSGRLTCGTVDGIDCIVLVDFSCGQKARFIGQLEVDGPFSNRGDSGAVVYGPGASAIGLLFAGNGFSYTFINPMKKVLDALQVDIVPIPVCARDTTCDR